MGITKTTYYVWVKRYPEISNAIKKGKAPVDIEVENALLKRALGFEYEEVTTEIEEIPTEKFDQSGNVIVKQKKFIKKAKKFVPPDTGAAIFWLKNRKPDQWKDKREQIISAKDGVLADLISGLKEPEEQNTDEELKEPEL